MSEIRHETIKAALAKIAKEGKLTAETVVEKASNPRHPLHDEFEWDDTVAGAKWRLEQARELIRYVHVTITTDTETRRCHVYVRDPEMPAGEQGYRDTATIVNQRQLSLRVVQNEMVHIRGAINRAQGAAAYLGVESELERMLEACMRTQEALAAH
jgi:hypothetical protein